MGVLAKYSRAYWLRYEHSAERVSYSGLAVQTAHSRSRAIVRTRPDEEGRLGLEVSEIVGVLGHFLGHQTHPGEAGAQTVVEIPGDPGALLLDPLDHFQAGQPAAQPSERKVPYEPGQSGAGEYHHGEPCPQRFPPDRHHEKRQLRLG